MFRSSQRDDFERAMCRRWNAARSFANYLDTHPELYYNKHVLELGAGGGLPGIVAAKNGARSVGSAVNYLLLGD